MNYPRFIRTGPSLVPAPSESQFPSGTKWIVYSYYKVANGDYDGEAIASDGDRFFFRDLHHCWCCNGPWSDGPWVELDPRDLKLYLHGIHPETVKLREAVYAQIGRTVVEDAA